MSTEADKPGRFSWAKLNADGLFVSLLMIGVGVFDMINIEDNPIIAAGNIEEAPFVYARCAIYVAAGLLILWSLLSQRINEEVVGRCLFAGAVVFQLWRRTLEFGILSSHSLDVLVLLSIFCLATYLRLRALLSEESMVYTIPPKKEE